MKKSYKSLELPDLNECRAILKEVFADPRGQPDAVRQSSKPKDMAHDASAVRTAEHKGHTIEIKTTYEIKIDGKPFRGQVMVDEEGHLHCHSIPYETYGSAVDFVKSLIDIYPDSFRTDATSGGHDCE